MYFMSVGFDNSLWPTICSEKNALNWPCLSWLAQICRSTICQHFYSLIAAIMHEIRHPYSCWRHDFSPYQALCGPRRNRPGCKLLLFIVFFEERSGIQARSANVRRRGILHIGGPTTTAVYEYMPPIRDRNI